MPSSPARSAFRHGMLDGAPFILVVAPFALLFGVLASESGWNAAQIFAMSFVVIAGASQFTALQLLNDAAPLAIVLLTGMAVNMRMAMYSASLVPHLGAAPLWQRALMAYGMTDQAYGLGIARYTTRPGMSLSERSAYYFGILAAICPPWYAFSLVGALAGQAIPPELALDFAVPITFIALFAPALRSVPHLAAAVASVIAALSLQALPYNLWMIAAALCGMIAGALAEILQERAR